MFDLRTKLLDLDEDLERLTWGVQAARAVSAAISQDHSYGELSLIHISEPTRH